MREEINGHESKLSDAEPANVSGGYSNSTMVALQVAHDLCKRCLACKQETNLARYLMKLYPNTIDKREECPFYKM